MYKKLIGHHPNDPAFNWIWKSFCQPKHKVFTWLLLKDRLSTRNILRRKNLHLESYNCELCNQGVEESSEHLFIHCPFAQQCWGLFNLETSPAGGIIDNFNAIKSQLHSQFFMETIILMCCTIWTARNESIFKANQISLLDCRHNFLREGKLVGLRVRTSHSLQFDQWIESLEMI